MTQTTIQQCTDEREHRNGQIAGAAPRVIDGVRYGECGHPVNEGRSWCGALYVIPEGVTYTSGRPCCGDERNHGTQPVLGVD